MTEPDRKDQSKGVLARLVSAGRVPAVWVPAGFAGVVGALAAVPPVDFRPPVSTLAVQVQADPSAVKAEPSPPLVFASLAPLLLEPVSDSPRLTVEDAVSVDLQALLASDETDPDGEAAAGATDEDDAQALQAVLAADQVFAALARQAFELTDAETAEIGFVVEASLAAFDWPEPPLAHVDTAAGVPGRVHGLSQEQRRIAAFIASRYRVAIAEIEHFVFHAFEVAREFALDPHLVLAVVAIESGFNPQARSPKGAQGLMQVLTRVHRERFAPFGGPSAAFDPVVNLTVGSAILKEMLVREGSIEKALKSYVGAALLPHDFGYGRKVLTEKARIIAAARARPVAPAPTGTIAAGPAGGSSRGPGSTIALKDSPAAGN
jgi:soluble lytic murein transglycosylase-like protein